MKLIVLDVVIGLIFIYLLYSLFLTIVVEMIATWLGMRARILRQGITNLLTDIKQNEYTGHGESEKPGFDILVSIRDFLLKEPKQFKFTKAGKFYDEPSVKYLTRGFQNSVLFTKKGKPSYISAENFYSTLLNMWRSKGQGICDWDRIKFAVKTNVLHFDHETNRQLNALLNDSDDDMGRFIYKLEFWFNEMMGRINGWYKRRIRLMLFWISFVLVALLNVDTISIVKMLSVDSNARNGLVEMAVDAVAKGSDLEKIANEDSKYTVQEQYNAVSSDAFETSLILGQGWDFKEIDGILGKTTYVIGRLNPFHKKLWGLIITSLALCLGAPFWFDLLKKLVSLRGSGIKPEEKAKQKLDIHRIEKSDLGKTRDSYDPVDIAIWKNRVIWENQPGFIEVNKVAEMINNKKKNVVELSVSDDFDDIDFPNEIPVLVGDSTHQVAVKLNKSSPADFQVANQITQGGMTGTIAGRMLNLKTGKECILSSAHVLAPDDSSIIYNNKAYDHEYGIITSIQWSNYLDAAIVDLDKSVSRKNWEAIQNTYEVNIEDADNRTVVLIKTNRGDLNAKIAHESYNFPFKYLGKTYNMYSLIKLIPIQAGSPMTQSGDSGALVVTKEENRPIGIIVGGTGTESFVIAIETIMDTLHISPLDK